MQIKIRFANRTQDSTIDLCKTCQFSVIISLQNGQTIRDCSELWHDRKVAFTAPVVECNRYHAKAETPLTEMKEMAWVLRTDKLGRSIGFKPYKQLKKDEQFDLADE